MTWRHIERATLLEGEIRDIVLPTCGILKALLIKADPTDGISKITFNTNHMTVMDIPTDFLNVLWIPIDLGRGAGGYDLNNMGLYSYVDLYLEAVKECEVSVWEMNA